VQTPRDRYAVSEAVSTGPTRELGSLRLHDIAAIEEVGMPTKDTGGQSHASRNTDETDEVDTQAAAGAEAAERKEQLDQDIDDILDEIDETLERNSEEWVRGFVQKGGE
jgi:prokaryotic ubiquitin-like protein Pup